MEILDHKTINGIDGIRRDIVEIQMEVKTPEIAGVLELTPRYKACAKRIASDLGFKAELVEVRADGCERYCGYQLPQTFWFSFEEDLKEG